MKNVQLYKLWEKCLYFDVKVSRGSPEERIGKLYIFYLKFKWKNDVDLGCFWKIQIDLSRLKW